MGRRRQPASEQQALFTALVKALVAAIGAELRGDRETRDALAAEAQRLAATLDCRWPGWRAWASRNLRRKR
ncbi:hypothetical protein NET02_12700 [Thermomicrobiaceae bacterium CFH 74404]|uniref:Uncharacterized protein n=1 Tax=Thermalbibacter longus TaxID=2951981 RepID=A0AA41WG77_9BACT|nr:hypothetical protein [Thermalbibacter longus]MCM8750009.1 hypothetical protein [Thermalbibacter longus]